MLSQFKLGTSPRSQRQGTYLVPTSHPLFHLFFFGWSLIRHAPSVCHFHFLYKDGTKKPNKDY